MILYVDETENEKYFIVTGLLVPDQESIDLAYRRFKKRVSSMKIKLSMKEKIFNEFKSTILDRQFQSIKTKMLKEIMLIDNKIIYSCYIKKGKLFNQVEKEKQYITLLSKIVSSIDENIYVIFDSFNKKDFEKNIIETIKLYSNVLEIQSKNSYDEPGIQFVDNICSVIRLSYLDSKNDYFLLIKDRVINV